MNRTVKLCCDLGPLVIFFVAYKWHGVYMATIALIAATIVATAVEYYFQRKISWLPIITVGIVSIMGGLTVFSGNEIFIKIKPTMINLIFAAVLLIGLLMDKLLVKYMLGKSLQMSDEAWKAFTVRWALFFIVLAILNELIWRNFSTDAWVNFKVFGIFALTIGFMIIQYPFLRRHTVVEETPSNT